MRKIAILDDYTGDALASADWGQLTSTFDITVFNSNFTDPNELIDRLKKFEVICAMRERTPFPAEVFKGLPNLKLFITSGMRNASVNLKAAMEQGIIVCGTQGSAEATPEHTWALVMACARNIPEDTRALKEGGWQNQLGTELNGKTLGLLGLGKIGGRVANYAKVFGMNVVSWSSNLTPERCEQLGVKLVSKENLFRQSDVLSVHLVLGDRSRNLITEDELKIMKSSAFLINTSRGPIINETALYDALIGKQIAGAAVDVFDVEPLPVNHRFRKLNNIIMTPHTGYFTRETYQTFYSQMIENIIAWERGVPARVLDQS